MDGRMVSVLGGFVGCWVLGGFVLSHRNESLQM